MQNRQDMHEDPNRGGASRTGSRRDMGGGGQMAGDGQKTGYVSWCGLNQFSWFFFFFFFFILKARANTREASQHYGECVGECACLCSCTYDGFVSETGMIGGL